MQNVAWSKLSDNWKEGGTYETTLTDNQNYLYNNRTKCVGGWQRQLCSLQAVGTLKFFGELYSLAKGFGPFLRGFGQALEKGRVLFLVTTSFAISTGVACPLPASRVNKPFVPSCYCIDRVVFLEIYGHRHAEICSSAISPI